MNQGHTMCLTSPYAAQTWSLKSVMDLSGVKKCRCIMLCKTGI